MAFDLRDVTSQDEAFLFQLYASTREQEMAAWGWDAAQVESFLRLQFRAQQASYGELYSNVRHQLIEVDGTAAGRILVSRDDNEMRLVDIALLPNFQRRGIGEKLIRELMDEASGFGLPLRLEVLQTSVAKRLYERIGFKATSQDPMYVSMEWVPVKMAGLGEK